MQEQRHNAGVLDLTHLCGEFGAGARLGELLNREVGADKKIDPLAEGAVKAGSPEWVNPGSLLGRCGVEMPDVQFAINAVEVAAEFDAGGSSRGITENAAVGRGEAWMQDGKLEKTA